MPKSTNEHQNNRLLQDPKVTLRLNSHDFLSALINSCTNIFHTSISSNAEYLSKKDFLKKTLTSVLSCTANHQTLFFKTYIFSSFKLLRRLVVCYK